MLSEDHVQCESTDSADNEDNMARRAAINEISSLLYLHRHLLMASCNSFLNNSKYYGDYHGYDNDDYHGQDQDKHGVQELWLIW
jgi:hypothetical protein